LQIFTYYGNKDYLSNNPPKSLKVVGQFKPNMAGRPWMVSIQPMSLVNLECPNVLDTLCDKVCL